jgi:hypothetical protein
MIALCLFGEPALLRKKRTRTNSLAALVGFESDDFGAVHVKLEIPGRGQSF